MITPKTREYRSFAPTLNDDGNIGGYAAVFNDTEVMYTDAYLGIEYKEKIDQHAFDECDMSDVVLNFNHSGKPVARTRNKTLQLDVDTHGLHQLANLSGTQDGRNMLEEIKGGYLDKMSFSFMVSEDAYDAVSHTRTLLKISKLFDVSVVDRPAYEATSVSARDYYSAKAEAERKASEDAAEIERKRKVLELKIKTLQF
jgi:HK97 family phage prohead protease